MQDLNNLLMDPDWSTLILHHLKKLTECFWPGPHLSWESLRRPLRGSLPYRCTYRRYRWGWGSHCACRGRTGRGQTARNTLPRPSAGWPVWPRHGRRLCWSALARKLAWSASYERGSGENVTERGIRCFNKLPNMAEPSSVFTSCSMSVGLYLRDAPQRL